jgi:tetratricopeptide (TPR) repeat protein
VLGKSISDHKDVLEYLPPMDFIYMSRLSTKQFLAMEPERRTVFYSQAWALTHYLFEGHRSHHDRMAEFLQRLASGQSLIASLEKSYGMSKEKINKAFRNYVEEAYYPDRKVALPEEFAVDWKPKAELMSREEILLRVSELGLRSRVAREQTLPLLRELMTLDPDNHEAARLMGVCLARQDSIPEALEWFEKSIELSPGDGLSHGLLGLSLLDGRRDADSVERALDHLGTAATQIPGDIAVQLALARVHRSSGEMDGAFAAYEAALNVQPWSVRIIEEYIDARAEAGQFAEARSILEDRLMPFASDHCVERVESRLAYYYEVRFDELQRSEGHDAATAFLIEAIEATHTPDERSRLARRLQTSGQ